MLIAFRTNGFKLFNHTIELAMLANNRIDTLKENVIHSSKNNLVKSVIVYGPNNSGKSNLVEGIKTFKKLFTKGSSDNFPFESMKNYLDDDIKTIQFEIEFIDVNTGNVYIYGVEIFENLELSEYLYINEDVIFEKMVGDDLSYNKNYLESLEIEILKKMNKGKLFISSLRNIGIENEHLLSIQTFFDKIVIFDNTTNSYNLTLMIEFLTDKNKKELLNKTLKLADITLDKRSYDEKPNLSPNELLSILNKVDSKDDKAELIIKASRVVSTYKKKNGDYIKVPSLFDDSLGTNKFAQLLIYIYNAMFNNEILIIDELDNSLHHALTKELIVLMNSKLNVKSQFIITSHDIKLLDSNLFRKDQVYLMDRNAYDVDLYAINQFKANSDTDLRSNSNYERLYNSGKLGALPNPDFYDIIEEFSNYEDKGFKESGKLK